MLPEAIEVGASLQPVLECLRLLLAQLHVGSAAGSSKWAYALRIGVCPARRRARRTACALLDLAMQSAFQEKCSYTMAIRGLLAEGSVTVRRMRAFAVATEMGRGGVSVAVAAAFANSSAASLPGMPL